MLRRLLHRVLDRDDARDLAADVEVQELQAVEHVRARPADRRPRRSPAVVRPNLARSPAESAQRPTPRGGELGAHAEDRPNAQLFRGAEDDVELLDALEHDDHGLVELLRDERRLDVLLILVAVADDEAARVLHRGERDQELGLASRPRARISTAGRSSTISSTRCRCWFTLTGNTPR